MWVTIAGRLSDVIGRKRMYMSGCVIMAIFGFVYYALLDTQIPWVIFVAVAISLIPVMNLYGPEAALIAKSAHRGFVTAELRLGISSLPSSRAGRRRSWRLAGREVSLEPAGRDLHIGVSIVGLIRIAAARSHQSGHIEEYENV